MIGLLASPEAWAALVTLIALEIILGIDNVIFLSVLALAFLVLIGVALVADGFAFHIPRGYIYFAIAFAVAVEAFNILARGNRARKTPASGGDAAAGPP
jgi:predicted tellurium resistance membrane protein TerC